MPDFKLRDKVRCIARPDIRGQVVEVTSKILYSDEEWHAVYVNCGRVYGITSFNPDDLELDDE